MQLQLGGESADVAGYQIWQQTSRMWMRNWRRPQATRGDLECTSRIAGILPWLAVLAVILCEFYVRVAFGRWPRVFRDSPETPLITAATLVAVVAALSYPAMVSVAVLLPIVRLRFQVRPVLNRWVFSSLIGATVLWLLSTKDPYGFLEWAFD